jgi:hypothetical protein
MPDSVFGVPGESGEKRHSDDTARLRTRKPGGTKCGGGARRRLESRSGAGRDAAVERGRQTETSVVEDKGGERLKKLLADTDRVRRVDNIREGMREADSAHETAPAMKRPRKFGQLPHLAVPNNVDGSCIAVTDTFEDPLSGRGYRGAGR